MNAGALHQLHNAREEHLLSVADGVHLHLLAHDIAVNEHRALLVDLHGIAQIPPQHFFIGYDLHGPAAQDEAGPHQHGIANALRCRHTGFNVRHGLALGIGNVQGADEGIEGIPVLRLRGDYLAIVTLAFGEIIKSVMNNVYLTVDKNGVFVSMSTEAKAAHVFDMETKKDIIKGAQGITGTPRDSTFVICFIVVFIAMIIMLNFMDSKQGRAVMASRDNRIAAEAMGVNVTRAKMSAFVMSAFFGGVAGVLYSHNLATLQAVKFDYNLSILILVFVVLGGMRKMRGVVIATALLYVLPEALRALNDYRMLIYAIVLIAMMLINNNAKLKAMGAKLRDSIRAKTGKKQAGGEA